MDVKATLTVTWAGNIFKEGTRESADAMLKEATDAAVHFAKTFVHVDTGQLRDSISGEQIDFMSWVVIAEADHAIYNEFGTVFQAPRPFIRPAIEAIAPMSHRLMLKAMKKNGKLERIRIR